MTGIVFTSYDRYVMVLKWLTLSLFAYVAALFAAHVDWAPALAGLFLPRITWSADFFTTLVAILGTTISPYLFFWQASQEAEDVKTNPQRKALVRAPGQARNAFERIHADTLVGMAFSNLIAIAIIVTTAATLTRPASPTFRPRRRRRKRSSRWQASLLSSCLGWGSSGPVFWPFRSSPVRRLMPSGRPANGRSGSRGTQPRRRGSMPR